MDTIINYDSTSHIPSFNDYINTFIKIEKNKDKTSKIFF